MLVLLFLLLALCASVCVVCVFVCVCGGEEDEEDSRDSAQLAHDGCEGQVDHKSKRARHEEQAESIWVHEHAEAAEAELARYQGVCQHDEGLVLAENAGVLRPTEKKN